ncbi:MAG: hypothetical protein ACWGOW_02930 [Gammaproteobacteria bacterium]
MANKQQGFLGQLRPLRAALILVAIITILAKPQAGAEIAYSGWEMVSTLLMPVFAPLIFMLLMLDALMSRVWMSEAEGDERNRLRLVMRVDLVVGLLLLVYWIPFFIALGR